MKLLFSALLLTIMPTIYSQNSLNGVISEKNTNKEIQYENQ